MKQKLQRKPQQEVVMVENGELVMAMEVLLSGRYLMVKINFKANPVEKKKRILPMTQGLNMKNIF
jgi:hypothetical protein